MADTLDDVVERPYMLNDIAVHAQRLSAVLPPDDWDLEAPRSRLERQPSGVFDLVRRISQDDAEDEQLIGTTLKPRREEAKEVAKGAAQPSWLQRVLRCICQCFDKHRDEKEEHGW